MMYVAGLNEILTHEIAKHESVVVFGQNIVAGSRLGGLGAGLEAIPGVVAINSTNTENSLVGMGMGLMLRGQPAVLLLKQEDFLVLAMDHLINTWNAFRGRDEGTAVPFVIGVIVVDNGWEGPQSGLNATASIASLARIPWATPSAVEDLRPSVEYAFRGGPRLLALSQRLFRQETASPLADRTHVLDRCVLYEWGSESYHGHDVIICLNFSLPIVAGQLPEIHKSLANDLLLINFFAGPYSMPEQLKGKLAEAKRVFIVSDEKTELGGAPEGLARQIQGITTGLVEVIRRDPDPEWSKPTSDVFEFSLPISNV